MSVEFREYHSVPKKVDILFAYDREYGFAIEDADDSQLLLFSLLDGKHTFATIVERLHAHNAEISSEDVTEILEDLTRLGLIEDAAVTPPQILTPTDLERYECQVRFFSVLDATGTQRYEAQARLKQAKVTILGLGGLGSNLLIDLSAIGVGYIRGVDFDRVELGNLNRQVLYHPSQLGQHKVAAAAEQVKRFNPEIIFEPVQCRIENSEQIVELIEDTDIVAMCADQPAQISEWVNQAALLTRTPLINGGYHGMTAEVGPFMIPFETSCLQCGDTETLPSYRPAEFAWLDSSAWLQHLNAHFVTATAANMMCSEICKHITRLALPTTYNQIFQLDMQQFSSQMLPHPQQSQCPACGGENHQVASNSSSTTGFPIH